MFTQVHWNHLCFNQQHTPRHTHAIINSYNAAQGSTVVVCCNFTQSVMLTVSGSQCSWSRCFMLIRRDWKRNFTALFSPFSPPYLAITDLVHSPRAASLLSADFLISFHRSKLALVMLKSQTSSFQSSFSLLQLGTLSCYRIGVFNFLLDILSYKLKRERFSLCQHYLSTQL